MISKLKNRQTGFPRKRICVGIDAQGPVAVAVRAERSRQSVRYTLVKTADQGTAASLEPRGALTVVACLSAQESLTRWLEAPLASPAKALRIFPSLLDIQLPFPIEDCVCAFLHPERTPHRRVRALAVAARRKDAENALDRARARGWDPHLLDHEGLALWTQSLREIPPDSPPNAGRRAVLYLGPDRWTLALGQNTRFLNSHALRAGDEAHLVRILKAEWGDGHSDAKPAANADGTTMLWTWAGPDAASEQTVAGVLQRMAKAWPGASAVHKDPGAFLARALATRALMPGPYRCNLRSGALTHPHILEQNRKRAAAPAWICLAAGALLIATSATIRTLVRHREAETERRFSKLRDTLLGYRLPVAGEDALREVRAALDTEKLAGRPFARALSPSLLEGIQALIHTCQQKDIHLETLDIGDDRIVLRGTAPDWTRGEELARTVESMGFPVTLKRESARDDGRIPWIIASRPPP